MKILVDTSVWSLALSREVEAHHEKVGVLKELIASGQQVCLTGTILQEILQGVRSLNQFQKLDDHLKVFALLPATREDHVAAASMFRECRSRGIQASTIDFLIAAVAMQHDCYLLTTDADFERIASVSPLRLL
jgi:hypothetical protein